ncbi:cullin-associated NEDD8-dissociated protein 1, partial [Tanacetum coccineum]
PLGYGGFPKSVCTSVNECMCHGIPDSRQLQDGDIMSIDINVYLNMDKVSVLENASNYIIKLQGRVLELEGSPGTKRKHVHESVISVKGSRRSASDDEYYLSDYMNSKVWYLTSRLVSLFLRDKRLRQEALLALQNFFATVFYSTNTSFDALLVSLLLTAKSSHQSAGIVKQALFSIAQCVVVLCLATEDYNCSSTRKEDHLEWKNRLRKLQNIMLGGSSHPPST